jgi:hypothetical protein
VIVKTILQSLWRAGTAIEHHLFRGVRVLFFQVARRGDKGCIYCTSIFRRFFV